jgi:hypothetical protein
MPASGGLAITAPNLRRDDHTVSGRRERQDADENPANAYAAQGAVPRRDTTLERVPLLKPREPGAVGAEFGSHSSEANALRPHEILHHGARRARGDQQLPRSDREPRRVRIDARSGAGRVPLSMRARRL